MGCCQSTDSGAHDAAPRHVQSGSPAAIPHDSSQAAINQPRSLDGVASPLASSVIEPPPSNNRPNKPVRAPTPVGRSPSHIPQHPPPWTRSLLERERISFFDTRVTGRRECWEALRLVCEMLRQGNVVDAQGVMDAANLSCPQGRVAIDRGRHRHKGGVYDERGELYDVPAWVVTDPQDVVEDDEEKDIDASASEDEESAEAIAAQRRREEKGKGRAEDIGEMLQVKCRLSDRARDVVVSVGSKQKVAVIVRGIQEQIGAKRVRLMYLGRVVHENKSQEDQGYQAGHVLNALVFEGDEGMLGQKASRQWYPE